MTDERKPWERREDETSKAYAGFVAYLQLGPQRSLVAAHRGIYGDPKQGPKRDEAPSFFKQWSVDFDWVARARAFDDYEMAEKLAAREQVREEARQVAVEAAREAVEQVIELMRGNGPVTERGAPAGSDVMAAAKTILELAGVTVPAGSTLRVSQTRGGSTDPDGDDTPTELLVIELERP